MKKSLLLAGLVAWMNFPTNVQAEENGSYKGYDAIVDELKTKLSDEQAPAPETYDDQDVAMHGGLAFTTSWVSLSTPNGARASGLLKGAEMSFGINLFSRNFRAEGAFSNFAQENLDGGFSASLKQFELRIVYLAPLRENSMFRAGTGLTARSMDVNSFADGRWSSYSTSTPDWSFLAGFERKISPAVTVGPDLSLRTALVSDAYEKTAWDATFRLNASF